MNLNSHPADIPTMYCDQTSLPTAAKGGQGVGIIPLGSVDIRDLGTSAGLQWWPLGEHLILVNWSWADEKRWLCFINYLLLLFGTPNMQLFQIKRSVCKTLLILNDCLAAATVQSILGRISLTECSMIQSCLCLELVCKMMTEKGTVLDCCGLAFCLKLLITVKNKEKG